VLAAADEAAMPSSAVTLPDVIPAPETADNAAALQLLISDLDLSVRASKCMSQLDVQTVADLMHHSESELLRTKNFGVTSLQELKIKLGRLGLSLPK